MTRYNEIKLMRFFSNAKMRKNELISPNFDAKIVYLS